MSLTSSEREALAIAYLTGQANAREVRDFEVLSAEDASFRALARELKTWLAPLDTVDPAPVPPTGLLDQILADISTQAAPQASVTQTSRRTVHWGWRPAALLAATVAIGAFVYPVAISNLGTPTGADVELLAEKEPGFVAALSDTSDAQIVVIVYDPGERRILARYSNVAPPEDGVWQLWLVREGLPAPQSLGLLLADPSADGQSELKFDEKLLPGTDLLAISIEPAGGSRQTGPSGPVVYTGTVSGLS